MNGNGRLAARRFGGADLSHRFKFARDFDTEVTEYRRAWLSRMVVEKNVVAMGPQAWLAAKELPDLVERRPPRGSHRARSDLAPHGGQFTGVNSPEIHGDGHWLDYKSDCGGIRVARNRLWQMNSLRVRGS